MPMFFAILTGVENERITSLKISDIPQKSFDFES